jgi:predicted GNAT family N-acyltransferase
MAYFTLSSGSVARANVVPKSHQRNSPSVHPVTLLGRMGITQEAQGQGFAIDLLQDAIERAITASESIGSSAIIVHPLNERLSNFYIKYAGFIPCPGITPITLMLPLR